MLAAETSNTRIKAVDAEESLLCWTYIGIGIHFSLIFPLLLFFESLFWADTDFYILFNFYALNQLAFFSSSTFLFYKSDFKCGFKGKTLMGIANICVIQVDRAKHVVFP